MTTSTIPNTQLGLLISALGWLSARTGVPYDKLISHMLVIGDVARVLDKYGSIYGEPTERDYDFLGFDWTDVYNLISEIWHEDKN